MPLTHAFTFGAAQVFIDPDAQFLETRFPDGSVVPACPHDTPEYRQTALRLGYNEDTWACCREHEVLHSFLADRLLHAPSPTLWAVAHDFAPGTASIEAQHREEALVLAFQGVLNGIPDGTGVLPWPVLELEESARMIRALSGLSPGQQS